MSKIEDALKKARAKGKTGAKGGGQIVPGPTSRDSEGKQLAPTHRRQLLNIESRLESSRNIAKMREPAELEPEQLALQKIIYPEMEESHIANSFRELRTKILQKSRENSRTIMVTSPTKGSGSSFVALNLAVSFSFDQSKTALLVDCNLWDSGLSKMLPSRNGYGLTDYLESTSLNVEEIIHPTGIKRLRVVPAGGKREIAAEHFTSFKMRALLSAIEDRYPDRYIFLDSPPVLESADSHILMELCDYVLLVVPYGRFTQSQIQEAADAISGDKLIGVIFNNAPCVPGQSWRRFAKLVFSGLKKVG